MLFYSKTINDSSIFIAACHVKAELISNKNMYNLPHFRNVLRMQSQLQNGVLLWLEHIFPNTYQGIRNIYSPAKVGIGCYKAVNYQPGS